MYEQFFGFKQRPFPASCHPRYYIPLEAMEAAREKLVRTVLRAEGAGLVIGPTGTGKSMLLHVIAQQLQSRCEVVLLAHGRFPNVRALLQAILCELRQPFRGMDEGELRLNLVEYLRSLPNSRPLALLVDEADTLSFRLLEEIRTLLNVMSGEDPAVRLVLAGGTGLEERLTAPKLQVLSQRIAARCYLDALNRSETFFYIEQHIKRAGKSHSEIFPEKTCEAVYHATGGVLRLINQVCDHALILAFADGLKTVTPELVQEAWSDLQQFPIPWDPVPRSGGASGVVEFGSWSDIGGESHRDLTADLTGGGSSIPAEPAEHQGWRDRPGQPLAGPHGELDVSPSAQESGEPFEVPTDVLTGGSTSNDISGGVPNQEPPEGLKDRPDPVARIDDVVATVSELENEMSAQTVRTPEVELVFYDWGDPFEEKFSQEIRVTPRMPTAYRSDFTPQTVSPRQTGHSGWEPSSVSSTIRQMDAALVDSAEITELASRPEPHVAQADEAPGRAEKPEAQEPRCPRATGIASDSIELHDSPGEDAPTESLRREERGEPTHPGGGADGKHEEIGSLRPMSSTVEPKGEQRSESPSVVGSDGSPDTKALSPMEAEELVRDRTEMTTPHVRRRFKSLFSQLRNAQ